MLGDMGAEVIRIERPGGEDDRRLSPFAAAEQSSYLMFTGHNKKGITLNLRKQKGRELLDELASDPRFQSDYDRSRPGSRQLFTDWHNGWAAVKTADEVVKQFNEAGLPRARINTIPEVIADPHIRAREMLVEVEHPKVGQVPLIGIPIKLSKTPGKIKTIAPTLGEHNEEIYCGRLGHTDQELTQLKEEGVL